jgi:hypothetical protein
MQAAVVEGADRRLGTVGPLRIASAAPHGAHDTREWNCAAKKAAATSPMSASAGLVSALAERVRPAHANMATSCDRRQSFARARSPLNHRSWPVCGKRDRLPAIYSGRTCTRRWP